MVWHRINSRSETMRWELQPHPPITINNFHGNISRLNILMQKNSHGKVMTGEEYFHELWGRDIPAWSLDRLRELIPENIFTGVRNQWHRVMYNGSLTYEEGDDSLISFREANIYDRCISCIEWLINAGHFPKEYLNGTTED